MHEVHQSCRKNARNIHTGGRTMLQNLLYSTILQEFEGARVSIASSKVVAVPQTKNAFVQNSKTKKGLPLMSQLEKVRH